MPSLEIISSPTVTIFKCVIKGNGISQETGENGNSQERTGVYGENGNSRYIAGENGISREITGLNGRERDHFTELTGYNEI